MPTYETHEFERVISDISLPGMMSMIMLTVGHICTQNIVVPPSDNAEWPKFVSYWKSFILEQNCDTFYIHLHQPEEEEC